MATKAPTSVVTLTITVKQQAIHISVVGEPPHCWQVHNTHGKTGGGRMVSPSQSPRPSHDSDSDVRQRRHMAWKEKGALYVFSITKWCFDWYKVDMWMCHCCCISWQYSSLSNVHSWWTIIDTCWNVALLLYIHMFYGGMTTSFWRLGSLVIIFAAAMTQKIPKILQACCVCFHMLYPLFDNDGLSHPHVWDAFPILSISSSEKADLSLRFAVNYWLKGND